MRYRSFISIQGLYTTKHPGLRFNVAHAPDAVLYTGGASVLRQVEMELVDVSTH